MNRIDLLNQTKAKNLIKPLLSQNIEKIKNIMDSDSSLISFQESSQGISLIHFVISENKCSSLEMLLLSGVSPNLRDIHGETPLFEAIYNYKSSNKKSKKCINILLENGANPNLEKKIKLDVEANQLVENGTSPLMLASSRDFGLTKLLIENGANIDHSTNSGRTASIIALQMKNVKTAHFLIAEKKANITGSYNASYIVQKPISSNSQNDIYGIFNKELYPVNILSSWIFPLDSKEYYLKMEIVAEFGNQGVDYFNREISDRIFQQIKKLYPENWSEYLKKY